ncbi:MAG: hypothetical protein CM1200mP2_41640 [Planctomycetaceae bacterium]|nr:MAG: hypothetical protein CM1200mP2_41640 [Planctomycetaceae bacterium]
MTGKGDEGFSFGVPKTDLGVSPGPDGTSPKTACLDLIQTRTRSSPSAVLTKILSSQTIGVAPLAPGRSTRQATFRFVSHETAMPFSADVPFPRGPRHDAQFSAETEAGISTTPHNNSSNLFDIVTDSRARPL